MIALSLFGELLVMLWDGFLLIGRRAGVPEQHLRTFADICWLATAVLVLLQTALVIAVGVTL